MAERLIDTYLDVVPAFRGYIESEESGRVWEIRILEAAPRGGGGEHPDGKDAPLALGNSLRFRWGREENGYGPTLMASTCEFEVWDASGAFTAFLRRQHDAERVRVVVIEARTPAMRAPAEPRLWTGTLYAPATERAYYRGLRPARVELTAYCGLGRLEKEEPMFIEEEEEEEERLAVSVRTAFEEPLQRRARLDVEYVIDALAEHEASPPMASGVNNLRFGEGLPGDNLREQLTSAAQTFGLRVFQGLRGAWRVQHRPSIGLSIKGESSSAPQQSIMLPERRLVVGARAGEEASLSDVRRIAGVRMRREGRSNYLADPNIEAWDSGRLSYYDIYGPAVPHADGARLSGVSLGAQRAGVAQRVMRIEPQEGGVNFRVDLLFAHDPFFSHDELGFLRVLLRAEDGLTYAWQAVTPSAGGFVRFEGEEGVALWDRAINPVEQIETTSDGVIITRLQRVVPAPTPGPRTASVTIPGHTLPAGGDVVVQAWGDFAALGTPPTLILQHAAFRIVDAAGHDVDSFEIVLGGDKDEIVDLAPAEGVEAWTGSRWALPTSWESRHTGQPYVDLPEYQAYDRIEQQSRDLLLWRGGLRGIVEPDTRLAIEVDGAPVELLPVSIDLEAAPRERSEVVAVELIL